MTEKQVFEGIIVPEVEAIIKDAKRNYPRFVSAVLKDKFYEKFEPQFRYFQGLIEGLYRAGVIEGTDLYWIYFEGKLDAELLKEEE